MAAFLSGVGLGEASGTEAGDLPQAGTASRRASVRDAEPAAPPLRSQWSLDTARSNWPRDCVAALHWQDPQLELHHPEALLALQGGLHPGPYRAFRRLLQGGLPPGPHRQLQPVLVVQPLQQQAALSAQDRAGEQLRVHPLEVTACPAAWAESESLGLEAIESGASRLAGRATSACEQGSQGVLIAGVWSKLEIG